LKNIPIVDKIPELDVALQAVIEAGNEILKIYGENYETSIKQDNSPVTEADLKSNEVINRILSKTDHQILSEEDKDDQSRLLQEIIWIVDPLDGTSDFIDKTGEFTVMIALVKNKKPILGIIGWPVENTIFAAQEGKGAFRYSKNEWREISVTKISEIIQYDAAESHSFILFVVVIYASASPELIFPTFNELPILVKFFIPNFSINIFSLSER